MKKIFVLLLSALMLVSCSKAPDTKPDVTPEKVETPEEQPREESETVGLPELGKIITFDVAYTYEDTRDPIKPCINLNLAEKRFSFTYSGK